MKLRILLLLTLSLTLSLIGTSGASASGGAAADTQETSVYESAMAGSSYSLGLQAGYGIRLWDRPNVDIAQLLPSITFPISCVKGGSSWHRGIWEYKVEGILGMVTNFNDRAELGLCPIGIKYNLTGGGKLAPYAELLLGAVWFNVPTTVEGTHFNFIECGGLGVQYFISRAVALNFEARFEHVSNAGIREPNRGVNSGFLLAGISVY